jgi:hypothetical protein
MLENDIRRHCDFPASLMHKQRFFKCEAAFQGTARILKPIVTLLGK